MMVHPIKRYGTLVMGMWCVARYRADIYRVSVSIYLPCEGGMWGTVTVWYTRYCKALHTLYTVYTADSSFSKVTGRRPSRTGHRAPRALAPLWPRAVELFPAPASTPSVLLTPDLPMLSLAPYRSNIFDRPENMAHVPMHIPRGPLGGSLRISGTCTNNATRFKGS